MKAATRLVLCGLLALGTALSPAWAKTQSVVASANGPTSPIPIDLTKSRCGVTLIVTFSNGANLTTTLQVTGDEVGGRGGGDYTISPSYNPATGHWNDHDTLVNLTASANGNLTFPVTAVRLNTSSYVAGNANLAVVQHDACPI